VDEEDKAGNEVFVGKVEVTKVTTRPPCSGTASVYDPPCPLHALLRPPSSCIQPLSLCTFLHSRSPLPCARFTLCTHNV
jgi:hypothetical protein